VTVPRWPTEAIRVRVPVTPTVQVVVHELGSGFPILCIPGLGADHTAFLHQVERLAERHRCLVLDGRGIGASDPAPGPYTMAALADDAAGVIERRTGRGRAHVFGVSMGGMVAQHLALRHPERVATLVLGCTTAGGAHAAAPDPEVVRQLYGGGARDPVTAYRNACRVMYAPDFQACHPEVIEAAVSWRAAHLVRGQTFAAQLAAIGGHDTDAALPGITAPTLVLHGSADVVAPVANGVRLAARIPEAVLETLPGRGHLFFQEDPLATDRLLARYLAVPSARAADR